MTYDDFKEKSYKQCVMQYAWELWNLRIEHKLNSDSFSDVLKKSHKIVYTIKKTMDDELRDKKR